MPIIVLSLGFEVATEDFFDPHYLVRNLASLFGIPQHRMRVPKIVPGSQIVDVEIDRVDPCDSVVTCGAHGSCHAGVCVCSDGWMSPAECEGGDCECSHQTHCIDSCATCEADQPTQCTGCKLVGDLRLLDVRAASCVSSCPPGTYLNHALRQCLACDSTCKECMGPSSTQCTHCAAVKSGFYYFLAGGTGGGDAGGGGGECLTHCPLDGYYLDPTNRTCLPCHSTCHQCRGPRATECTSCTPNPCVLSGTCPPSVTAVLDESSFWTVYKQVPHITGSCVSTCRAGRAPRYVPLGLHWKEVIWDEAAKPGTLNEPEGNVVEIRGGWGNKSHLAKFRDSGEYGHGREDNRYPANLKKRLHGSRHEHYKMPGVSTISWRQHRAMHGSGDSFCDFQSECHGIQN